MTPILTPHARARCAEMGISTKVAKAIVRHADIVRPGYDGKFMSVSDLHPKYAVVHTNETPPVIVSVVFRTYEHYDRAGDTWTPSKEPRAR